MRILLELKPKNKIVVVATSVVYKLV